MSFEGTNN